MAYTLVLDGRENINVDSSPMVTEEKICTINITLKPGDKLIIDSELYNVFQNGTSIIESQSGSWFDELDRNTVSLILQASSNVSDLSGRVVYTERFL